MEQIEAKTLVQCVKLVDGIFTPDQAYDVIKDLIDTKINHHKLSRLNINEQVQNKDTSFDSKRLDELNNEKKRLMAAIQQAKKDGRKVKLMSLIDIEYLD